VKPQRSVALAALGDPEPRPCCTVGAGGAAETPRAASASPTPTAPQLHPSCPCSCHQRNHRITEWWGLAGPSGVTQPSPLPKQGHPEQAAQHRGQAGLEYLQRRRLHSLPGQPGPGLHHPQREEVLPRVPHADPRPSAGQSILPPPAQTKSIPGCDLQETTAQSGVW